MDADAGVQNLSAEDEEEIRSLHALFSDLPLALCQHLYIEAGKERAQAAQALGDLAQHPERLQQLQEVRVVQRLRTLGHFARSHARAVLARLHAARHMAHAPAPPPHCLQSLGLLPGPSQGQDAGPSGAPHDGPVRARVLASAAALPCPACALPTRSTQHGGTGCTDPCCTTRMLRACRD